jgi:hypothetical protein
MRAHSYHDVHEVKNEQSNLRILNISSLFELHVSRRGCCSVQPTTHRLDRTREHVACSATASLCAHGIHTYIRAHYRWRRRQTSPLFCVRGCTVRVVLQERMHRSGWEEGRVQLDGSAHHISHRTLLTTSCYSRMPQFSSQLAAFCSWSIHRSPCPCTRARTKYLYIYMRGLRCTAHAQQPPRNTIQRTPYTRTRQAVRHVTAHAWARGTCVWKLRSVVPLFMSSRANDELRLLLELVPVFNF